MSTKEPNGGGRDDELRRRAEALAALRWEDVDHDIRHVDEWGDLDTVRNVDDVKADGANANFETTGIAGNFERDLFANTWVNVFYDDEEIVASIEAEGEPSWLVATARLSPDQARELAAVLAQAAEEQERWTAATEADQ